MPLVLTGLRDSILAARTAGVPSDRIVLDPGLGFGKLGDENYTILALLPQMLQFGLPILCGASRKGFLGRTLAHLAHPTDPPDRHPTPPPEARLHATTAANVAAILAGAHLLRVHDVRPAREAAVIADAILAAAAEFTANTGPAFAGTISSTPQ
jgi:dihydropteroate synthase